MRPTSPTDSEQRKVQRVNKNASLSMTNIAESLDKPKEVQSMSRVYNKGLKLLSLANACECSSLFCCELFSGD